MKVLDLFCGEGGASQGYANAGFEVVGVDNDQKALKRYPFRSFCGDWLMGMLYWLARLPVDLIHASPPCQGYSHATPQAAKDDQERHPRLIADVRKALRNTGLPYVLENVEGARKHLDNPTRLCGCMFDLTVQFATPRDPGLGPRQEPIKTHDKVNPACRVPRTCSCKPPKVTGKHAARIYGLQRPRLFENNFRLSEPRACDHSKYPFMPVVQGTPSSFYYINGNIDIDVRTKGKLMGCEWMSGIGIAESIPPAFTEYIGKEFLAQTDLEQAA